MADNERKTLWVVLLTAVTMVVEITFGTITGSMALLADGIHMSTHVLAIGMSWLAYVFVRRLEKSERFTGNTQKILSLSGYTSGLFLLIFSLFILVEAIKRFFLPIEIHFKDALIVAVSGLLVNIASAFILHHDEHHSDHNIRAAYLHVIADAITSLSAIIGITAGMIWNITIVDTLAAVASSFVIIHWARGLLKSTGKELLDIGVDEHDHKHEHHHHH